MKIIDDILTYSESDFDGFSDQTKKSLQLLSIQERLGTIADLFNRSSEQLITQAEPLLKSAGVAAFADVAAEIATASPEKVEAAKAAMLAELRKP